MGKKWSDICCVILFLGEQEGPWFRICDDRVERLVPKVDFTEWKCHRDFFCAGAVYIAVSEFVSS